MEYTEVEQKFRLVGPAARLKERLAALGAAGESVPAGRHVLQRAAPVAEATARLEAFIGGLGSGAGLGERIRLGYPRLTLGLE
ncbi:hypothetical protein [Kitasatospora purpeofusca]|uniref:hypothetical protein n=1 Tax=Kitasatospora purpeofusca TaxID=67352 RepID=UPI003868EFF6|nr:hypothetical protein OIP63_20425 [Kitasatospora purpeofusca]